VIKNPRLLEKVMEGLGTETARVKFGCAKALRVLSETRPDLLYPRFDFFVRLLDNPNLSCSSIRLRCFALYESKSRIPDRPRGRRPNSF
jgi:hypothetical protein